MVNNLVFRWPKPLFFLVLGADGNYSCRCLDATLVHLEPLFLGGTLKCVQSRCQSSFRKHMTFPPIRMDHGPVKMVRFPVFLEKATCINRTR